MTFSVSEPAMRYSALGADMWGSAIDASLTVLASIPHPVISFAMGSPGLEAMPTEALSRSMSRVLVDHTRGSALDYSPTEGDHVLRAALLERAAAAGERIDPGCLLITAGGMQGLDLVAKLFLSRGDTVLAEAPSYANGLATIHNHGATILQVDMDEEGLDIDAALAAVRVSGIIPRLIYAIPTFQNPSGLTYSLERRIRLLELARSWGALVVEDDPYSELRYGGEPVPSLLALDGDAGTVIQVRTFSKIAAPGLRVGWLIGATDTIRRMTAVRQSMDTCANTPAQRAIAELILSGDLDSHVRGLRALYPQRRDLMLAALEQQFAPSSGLSWSRPLGGMFIWVRLPEPVAGQHLLAACLREGVAIVPGEAFNQASGSRAFRLCFSAPAASDIAEGVRRVGVALGAIGVGA